MKMVQLKIRHFRSIERLSLDLTRSSIICGPNSCGKSNILRALKFAFLPSFSAERTAQNFCNIVNGPAAKITIRITFDKPTSTLSQSLALPEDQQFTYELKIPRNGKPVYNLNGQNLDEPSKQRFLDEIAIVHVPPIRDLSSGGLDPFRATLAAVIRRSRGADSLGKLNSRVREAVKRGGHSILSGTQATARSLLEVEALSVDVDSIEIDTLLPLAGINFRINGRESSLDKLGTGHQSSVILSLYRQLGIATGKFVLYLFEEPDNHLHPTSLRAIADDLKQCLSDESQALITTHSPYFLNQFPITDWLPLTTDSRRTTALRTRKLVRSDRELRIALGKYGLRPPEALLSRKVVVVEGANDVTLIRELIEIETKRSPDQQDLLIIPAGGKEIVSDLCLLLGELGASWIGVFDWDAVEDTRQPQLQSSLASTDIATLNSALLAIEAKLRKGSKKKSKAQKTLESLRTELNSTNTFRSDFAESALGKHLIKSKVISASEMTTLRSHIKRKSMRAIRTTIEKANTWIWSGTPEEILLSTSTAETIVERKLIQHTLLAGPVAATNRKATLINALHNLGHQPEILQDIIRELHSNSELRGREWRDLVKMLVR